MRRILVSTMLLALSAATALAEEPKPSPAFEAVEVPSLPRALQRQWTIEDVAPELESPDTLRSRDDASERLTLREAVAVALENNPGIAVERLGPLYAGADVQRVSGAFDPLVSGLGRLKRTVTPATSALTGALELRERENLFNLTVSKLVRTGATFSVAFESQELDSNSRFLGLQPQYKPTLTFSVSQPLLKNFGPGLSILLVRSAEAGSGAAYYLYKAKVSDFVRQVVDAYWGVVRAQENLKAEEDGLKLAETLRQENDARVRAGTLPPIAVKEAGAEAAGRQARVIVAENALAVARDRLRLLLQRNPSGAFVPRAIEPADSPEVRDVDLDEQELIESCMAHRPEIQQARFQIEQQKILAKVRRNGLLPQLDAQGSYGLNGLSGRPVPVTDFRTGETVVTPFGGDYGDGLDRLQSGNFSSYSGGLALSFPLGNDTARADYAQSEIDLRRRELGYRQLVSDVTLDVRKTLGDVRADSKRITATRLARELAQENLEQQKKRYDVGLATTKDILDFQEKLTTARAAEIAALIDYNVSLAALRRAEGRLLEQFDVVLQELPETPTPFWARF